MEIVTVGLEMGGADVLRPFIEDAEPRHPSLVDEAHVMDALFGVVNIPSGIWIDEDGTIVRPHEPAVPPPVMRPDADGNLQPHGMGGRFGIDADEYANKVRDWAEKGADSEYALSPEDVIAQSQPRPVEVSQAAAHFELAQHLWRTEGFTDKALHHFAQAHTLQPHNITYKRQAYSQYRWSKTDEPNDFTRFMQSPTEGEEWPFPSNFDADMATYLPELRARIQRELG